MSSSSGIFSTCNAGCPEPGLAADFAADYRRFTDSPTSSSLTTVVTSSPSTFTRFLAGSAAVSLEVSASACTKEAALQAQTLPIACLAPWIWWPRGAFALPEAQVKCVPKCCGCIMTYLKITMLTCQEL